MIREEELSGIVEVLGAVTVDEMINIVKELAYLRDEQQPEGEDIKVACHDAIKKHYLEEISVKNLKEAEDTNTTRSSEDMEADDLIYLIAGPLAFPNIPFELTDIIDILGLKKRELDHDKVFHLFSRNLKARINRLVKSIEEAEECPSEKDIQHLEQRYSDLINTYYDYSCWLEGDLTDFEPGIEQVSRMLEELKERQSTTHN